MRLRVVPVALLLVVAGCSGFGGPSGDRAETPTLTPAPVPQSDARAAGNGTRCLAPSVADDVRTPPPTPATPVALPVENGTVRGGNLVGHHLETLAAHSFSLRVGSTSVTSMPRASAFSFNGTLLGFGPVHIYAVGGTMYRRHETDDGVRVSTKPYRPGSERTEWYLDVLTGEVWLNERVSRSYYRPAGNRTWNGVPVRVFESTWAVTVTEGGRTVPANSTLFVDRRGIIRHVRHVRVATGPDSRTRVERYTVTDVGTATLSRPDAFCVSVVEAITPTPPPEPPGDLSARP